MEEKKKKTEYIDDNSVIADMSVDGMPGSIFGARRPRPDKKSRKAGIISPESTESTKEKQGEELDIPKGKLWSVSLGVATSYLLFGLFIAGIFALLIFLSTRFWFR